MYIAAVAHKLVQEVLRWGGLFIVKEGATLSKVQHLLLLQRCHNVPGLMQTMPLQSPWQPLASMCVPSYYMGAEPGRGVLPDVTAPDSLKL